MAVPRVIPFVLAMAVSAVCAAPSSSSELAPLYEKVGLSVPQNRVAAQDFQLSNLEGNPVSLKSLRGKLVMLNFWATWCRPCVEEVAALESLYSRYKNDGFVILAINYGESKEKVQSFVNARKISFPVLLDPEGEVSRKYRTFALPTTYLVDRQGYFLAGVMGVIAWNSTDFHTIMKKLLKDSAEPTGD